MGRAQNLCPYMTRSSHVQQARKGTRLRVEELRGGTDPTDDRSIHSSTDHQRLTNCQVWRLIGLVKLHLLAGRYVRRLTLHY